MKKILWIGDAACASGFGRCTTEILERVRHSCDVAVIGINYHGDPHELPYKVYPAQQPGSHPLGYARMQYCIITEKPDVMVIQSNPWNFPGYLRLARKHAPDVPVIGIVAVEGKNPGGHWLGETKDGVPGLDHAIFWTDFGRRECEKTGWRGQSTVIPLGVDTEKFKPGNRALARETLGLPDDVMNGFFVTNVNRNQHRKRLDLSIIAFAKWVTERRIDDAYLYLHAMQGSTVQLDVEGVVRYCGIDKKVIWAEPVDVYLGTADENVVKTYQASNIGLSSSLGEGWGLTTMESMSCGKANIATLYSACAEWGDEVLQFTEPVSEGVMPDVYGQMGGTPSLTQLVENLDLLYRDEARRTYLEQVGRARVNEERFSWNAIGREYVKCIEAVLGSRIQLHGHRRNEGQLQEAR